MNRHVEGECGHISGAATDNEVVARIREHLSTDHPDLLNKTSDDEIRSWFEIVA